jgi:hypothetical protein
MPLPKAMPIESDCEIGAESRRLENLPLVGAPAKIVDRDRFELA